MFTSGQHIYLYLTAGCYFAAFLYGLRSANKPAVFFLVIGIVFHTLYLLGRGWIGGIFVPNAIVEGPYFLPWCLSMISLVMYHRKPENITAGVVGLTFAFTIFAIWYANGIIPPTPKKLTIWAILFFVSEIMAHALFYAGAVYAFAVLLNKKIITDFHQFIIWGFVFYTIAQVTGAVWSWLGWGNTFNWSSRHLTSASIWMLYAAYLHIKFLAGWNLTKRSVYIIIAGIFVCMITYTHYLHEMTFPRIGG